MSQREEYVASELKKWEEVYEIPFEQEFNVKALLSLRHQFSITPDDHVKTKVDLLHAMQKLMNDMNLNPKKTVTVIKNGGTLIVDKDGIHLKGHDDLQKELVFRNVRLGNNQYGNHKLRLSDYEEDLIKNSVGLNEIKVTLHRAKKGGLTRITDFSLNDGVLRTQQYAVFNWGQIIELTLPVGFDLSKITASEYVLLDKMVFEIQ